MGVQEVAPEKVSSYGIIDGAPTEEARTYTVKDMVEKPAQEEAPSRLAVLGRYIITPEIFDILENTPPGRGNEIQLTDALRVLAKQQPMYAYNLKDAVMMWAINRALLKQRLNMLLNARKCAASCWNI